MANRWRGDVPLVVDGERCEARLTLGALAELEDSLDAESLVGLVERFEGSRFTSRDVVALLGAGLRGTGKHITDAQVADAHIEGGPMAAAKAAAELLARAFVVPE
ncbi:gene transfer agent family protein [Sulfitobacter sp. F26204]|uniref:gene transfer agent family protein n=1 Tax=Sulfitobacter sp. F26204 TaxID=2996014 RepID=UPI00225E24BF|nr:gene transfer agent family protein [Sulfitobacter sp. F26204]MCX7560075.1 gene transfer agent family protein [Sulfitobacter sp. F26204]